MGIIKKTIASKSGEVVVGYDTEKKCYCNLPDDYEESFDGNGDDIDNAGEPTESWTPEALLEYAKRHNIDTGMATTSKGIMEKIKAAKV